MNLYLNIFIAFFRSGMLGFGGGPSSIPLIHKEVVSTFKWMTDDEFSNVVALGNTLPGPINTKMAGYIGYRVGGMIGLLVALFAGVLPTVLLMLALLTSFNQFKDNPNVQGMTNAIVPIVGVMMGVLTWGFLKKAKNGLGWKNREYSSDWMFYLYCRASNSSRNDHWIIIDWGISFTRKEEKK